MAVKKNSIEWVQAIDKEEYIGYFDGQKYFIITMMGYFYKCKSLPVIPVRRDFANLDKSLNKLKKRAQEEFDKNSILDDNIISSSETKQKLKWHIFQN